MDKKTGHSDIPRKETLGEKANEVNMEQTEALIPADVTAVEKTEVAKVIIPGNWKPRTDLGKAVAAGKITDINELFEKGIKITESEIVDVLVPDLEDEIILIGGSTGKGGGVRRTPARRTTRMHKSGRRYRMSVMVAVGNKNGYIGIAVAKGPAGKHRDVVNKAMHQAKLNLIPIRRGCGSWECGCGNPHSIPFEIVGRCGSVTVDLKPAPKGLGLCVNDEVKKILKLAGITDVWCKSRGQTSTRVNFIRAVYDALQRADRFRMKSAEESQKVGLKVGRVD